MRSDSGWHQALSRELRDAWPDDLGDFPAAAMLDVELGLYLLSQVMPGRPSRDAWVLFGGYPYAEATGHARTNDQRLRIRRARHYLWPKRRRRVWLTNLDRYRAVPQELRGYLLDGPDDAPARRSPARAPERFEKFEELLTSPPEFSSRDIPRRNCRAVPVPGPRPQPLRHVHARTWPPGPAPLTHDLDAIPAGRGAPVVVTWADLQAAAAQMDKEESALPASRQGDWTARLHRVELLVRQDGGFVPGQPLRVDGLLHMVGMVGARGRTSSATSSPTNG